MSYVQVIIVRDDRRPLEPIVVELLHTYCREISSLGTQFVPNAMDFGRRCAEYREAVMSILKDHQNDLRYITYKDLTLPL